MRIAGHLFQMPGLSVVLVLTIERKQGELMKETIEVLPTCFFAHFPRRCLFTDGKQGQHMPALHAAANRKMHCKLLRRVTPCMWVLSRAIRAWMSHQAPWAGT
uniref:Putative secreted protein n=1 Tax=Ixodes ricinus TaxID=34613 RepID=A0A147BEJ1_IXORI